MAPGDLMGVVVDGVQVPVWLVVGVEVAVEVLV